jgi:hypothetical protein
MSTKTLKQRIALVAASALTAGFLSVVSAPVANAADGEVMISLKPSTTGSAVTSTTQGDARQVGWVTATNTVGVASTDLLTLASGDAQTGICLSTCSLAFEVENESDSVGISVVVSGGVLSSLDDIGAGETTLSLSGNRQIAHLATGATNSSFVGIVSASSGATTMQVQFYRGTGVAGLTSATAGTLLGSLTLTIAAASASGTFSAANSVIATQIAYAAGSTASGLLTYDNTSRISNGYRGAIYVSLKDPYTAAITTGTVTATATNGANVNINDAAPAAGHDYAATSAFDTDTDLAGGDAYITVTQPVANTAGSTTVTITLDGAVIATKTLNWNGDIASIALDSANSNSIFKNGADVEFAGGQNGLVYVVKDAAGNAVHLADTASANANGPTMTGQTGAMVGASLTATLSTTTAVLQTVSNGYGTTTVIVPTSALNGAGTYKLRVVNAQGANVDSAAINATVSGGLDSFAISWDKAVYAPGDLATLTITGKDSKGTTIADGVALAGLELSVASGLTAVGTACTTASTFSGGKVTCKYSAGNTAGAYSYSIDLTTSTAQAASVGAVQVKTSAVSNEDVLKSIVALIASINKQIQALQKLILKR